VRHEFQPSCAQGTQIIVMKEMQHPTINFTKELSGEPVPTNHFSGHFKGYLKSAQFPFSCLQSLLH
jgi:hypothetical protein